LRDWMEGHLHWRVLGVIDWPRYRLLSRCWCGRLMWLHTPWALFICERTPLPIEITEKGYALLAEMDAVLPDWQIVPVNARDSA
jgi:hypothetical protein